MKIKRITYIFTVLCLVLYLLFGNVVTFFARAESSDRTGYTTALTDLQKDSSFDKTQYPIITDKAADGYGSIEVIQIGESEYDELFIYTYEPSESVLPFEVTTVNLWNGYSPNGEDFTPVTYDLEMISRNGVFAKYVVENYTIPDEAERYYNIVSIHRKFVEDFDSGITDGETTEKAIKVGQQWCVYTYNDVMHYEMNTFRVLEITPKHTGTLPGWDGLTLNSLFGFLMGGSAGESGCDLHYIAFTADNFDIKKIWDADVSYDYETGIYSTLYYEDEILASGRETVRLYDDETVSFEGRGLWGRSYEWKKILSAKSFLSTLDKQGITVNTESKSKIEQADWVFTFAQSEYDSWTETTWAGHAVREEKTKISNVSVMRVHFCDISNKVYNLGVVCDKVTPDDILDGIAGSVSSEGCRDFLEALFGLIAGILLVILIVKFLPFIIMLLKAVIWVIVLPFKAIGAIFKGIGNVFRRSRESAKERKREREAQKAEEGKDMK